MSIFEQNGQVWPLAPNLVRNGFLVRNWDKKCWNKSQYPRTFRQNEQLRLFCSKFAHKGIKSCKLIKQMLEKEPASLRYHVYQFLDKTDNFEFLDTNLPKKEIRIWNSES